MAQSILDIILRTKKEGTGVSQTTKDLKELKTGLAGAVENLTGFSIGSLGVAAAIAGIGAGMKKAVDDTVTYAAQIREVQRLTGATAEDSSRLIQVTDDLGVEYDSLKKAMIAATKQGVEPSIDGLAKLSDEYLALEPGQERSEFLLKKFGKSGLDMAEAMEQGGAALRQMSADMSGNLVLTQAQVDAGRQYEKSLDNLGDRIKGYAMAIGNTLIPIFIKALDAADKFFGVLEEGVGALDLLVNRQAKLKDVLDDHNKQMAISKVSQEEYTKEMERAAQVAGFLVNARGDLLTQNGQMIQQGYVMTASQREETRAEADAALSHERSIAALEKYRSDKDENIAARALMTQAIKDQALAGYDNSKALEAEKTKTDLLNGSMGELTRQTLFQAAAEGMSADQKLRLAQTMGLVDERSYEYLAAVDALRGMMATGKITVEEYNQRVAALADSYDRLHDVNTTITTNFVETHTSITKTGYSANAAGGEFTIPPGFKNETYHFPGTNETASSGETVKIIPAGGASSGGGGGGKGMFAGATINIVSPMTLEMFKQMLVSATK